MVTKYIYKNYIIIRSLMNKFINTILLDTTNNSPIRIYNKKQSLLTHISNYYSEPSLIIDNIYIGNITNARDYYRLKKLNIGLIVNCAKEINNFFSNDFDYINLKILDIDDVLIYPHLDNIVTKMYNYLQNNNNKILVHCYMGASRSVSIVIAYLIKYKGYNFEEALKVCNNKRDVVDINVDFCNQLIMYENSL